MNWKQSLVVTTLLLGCAGLGHQAIAGEGPVQLKASPPIAKDVAALPRIVAPADDQAAQRINQALDKLDKLARNAMKECRASIDLGAANGVGSPDDFDYERSIWIAMRGPRYLSFYVGGSSNCGGAHPNAGTLVFVYDLKTGSPVNWQRLLPKAMVQGTSTDIGMDGATVGFVTSKTLQDLYLKAYGPMDSDCNDILTDPQLKLNLWPDGKLDGLGIEPGDVIHAEQACADSRVIPTATLRSLGVNAGLLDAIDAAYSGGYFDKDEPVGP